MQQTHNRSFLTHPRFEAVILLAGFAVFSYWFALHIVEFDPYQYIVVGAIYEMVWLPMVLGLAIVPIIAIVQIFKTKNNFPLLPIISLLLVIAAIIVVALQ